MSTLAPSEEFDPFRTPFAPGVTLIQASAGTGKTFSITALALRALLEGEVEDLTQVLIVTFTKAATVELEERLRLVVVSLLAAARGEGSNDLADQLLPADANAREALIPLLQRAQRDAEHLSVFTIHSFCKRVLEERAFESGMPFSADFIEDEVGILKTAVADWWRERVATGSEWIAGVVSAGKELDPDAILALCQLAKAHPSAEVEPPAQPLDAALLKLQQTFKVFQATYDPASLETMLGTVKLLKAGKAVFGPETREATMQSLAALKAGDQTVGWESLRDLATLPADKPGMVGKPDRARCLQLRSIAAAADLLEARAALLLALKHDALHSVQERCAQAKQAREQLGFDDLLESMASAVVDEARGPQLIESVRSQYKIALIDEFQDTDARQLGIFEALWPKGPLYFVGDPKQAIYGFRGADLETYLAAAEKADRHFTLKTNYRSRSGIVRGILQLMGLSAQPFLDPRIPLDPVEPSESADNRILSGPEAAGPEVVLALAERLQMLPEDGSKDALNAALFEETARRIRSLAGGDFLIDGARPDWADFAVLVRKNHEAQAMRDTLSKAQIPAVVQRAGALFESFEAEELARVLAAVLSPQNTTLLRAAMATQFLGYGAAEIAEHAEDETAGEDVTRMLYEAQHTWALRGVLSMLQGLMVQRETLERVLVTHTGLRRATNYRHLCECLAAEESQNGRSQNMLLSWLQQQREATALREGVRERVETDGSAVQVMTIHTAKGLEFGIVFCPMLWDMTGPPPRGGGPFVAAEGSGAQRRLVLDALGGADRPLFAALCAGNLAEALRLTYVALTRAKWRLELVFTAGSKGKPGAAPAVSALSTLLLDTEPLDREQSMPARASQLDVRMKAVKGDWAQAITERVEGLSGVACTRWPRPVSAAVADPVPVALDDPLPTPRLESGFAVRTRSSFSSLKEERGDRGPEGLDAIESGATAPEALAADSLDLGPAQLEGFARGVQAGLCLHSIVEHAVLTDPTGEKSQEVVEAQLAQYGLDRPGAHPQCADPAEAVSTMLKTLCAARLQPELPPVSEWEGAGRLIREWEFLLPVEGLDPSVLGPALLLSENAEVRAAGEHLTRLRPKHYTGELSGIVDAVLLLPDGAYLFDWKSNDLGPKLQDYHEGALLTTMLHADYLLQLHLYAVALRRHLALRSGVDAPPLRAVGCVFLRGLQEDPGAGVYAVTPEPVVLDALEEILMGGRPHER